MKSYQLTLKSRNHDVVSASDGEECLKMFNDHIRKSCGTSDPHFITSRTVPFDLVILDYRMPKKNGVEVAEQILSMAPDQRIIIASAYTNDLKIPNSCEVLQKPFGIDVLFSAVEKVPAAWTRKYGQRPSINTDILMDGPNTNAVSLDEQFNKISDGFDLGGGLNPNFL